MIGFGARRRERGSRVRSLECFRRYDTSLNFLRRQSAPVSMWVHVAGTHCGKLRVLTLSIIGAGWNHTI